MPLPERIGSFRWVICGLLFFAAIMLVPIVNFDNSQHEENENLRPGTYFDGIVTITAVLRM